MVLSDDLVFAFSTESGGPLDAAQFSLQLPQSIVQRPSALVFLKQLEASLFSGKEHAKGKGKVEGKGADQGKVPLRAEEKEERLAALFNWGNRLLPASNSSLLALVRQLLIEETSPNVTAMSPEAMELNARRQLSDPSVHRLLNTAKKARKLSSYQTRKFIFLLNF